MKVKHKDKVYEATIERDARIMITIGKEKVFAGFGEGNMNYGFELVAEVQEDAPVSEDS